jgi:hypothetical protein
MKSLNKMLAQEEPALEKIWASTHPFVWLRPVLLVQGKRDRHLLAPLPLSFEVFAPRRKLAVLARVGHHKLKPTVISRCQFHDQNPNKKVETRLVEVVKEVPLDSTPTAINQCQVEYNKIYNGNTYWLSTIIVVLSRGISGCSERPQSSHCPRRYQFSHRYAHVSGRSLSKQKVYICLTAHSGMTSGLG